MSLRFGFAALVCAALLGFGYYLQYGKGLEPCPLCLVQRGFFIAVMAVCIVAAAGRVVAVTEHTIVVVDTLNPASQLNDSDYARFGGDFDRWGYSVVTENFGEPSDLDENGHVIAFFTRAVTIASSKNLSAPVLAQPARPTSAAAA
jgi:hypothetical protein